MSVGTGCAPGRVLNAGRCREPAGLSFRRTDGGGSWLCAWIGHALAIRSISGTTASARSTWLIRSDAGAVVGCAWQGCRIGRWIVYSDS